MNIVIPVAISMMYDRKRILCLSNFKSKKGGSALLSTITKIVNETADVMNAPAICDRFSELIPICISVSAITNEDIVTERASTPLMSIENDACFLFGVFSGALTVTDRSGSLFSFTNMAIINVTKAEKGTIAKKVECHPKC